MMASGYNGTLYIGATSKLVGRVHQHIEKGFSTGLPNATTLNGWIAREKTMKKWPRDWKRNLIERQNPEWNDLAVGLGLPSLWTFASGPVDPGTSPG